LKDAFPGYIDWEEFMANSGGSRTISITKMRTAMGCRAKGNALLCKAIAYLCGRCGRPWGCIIPARTATTLSIFVAPISINMAGRAVRRCAPWGVDAAVERLLLEALTPDRLALAIAALGELENEARALERQWSLKRERTRYQAERAAPSI